MMLHPRAVSAAEAEPQIILQPMLLTATVNGHRSDEAQLFLQDGEGRLYVSESFLRQWRLTAAGAEKIQYDGGAYYRLPASDMVSVTLSQADQTLAIEAAANLFDRQLTAFDSLDVMPMTQSGTGGFLNYDVFAERVGGVSSLNGAAELGMFTRFGVGSTGFIGKFGGDRKLTRLETNWIIDRPESLTSLRVGDGISSGGASAPPVRFAGFQYARNFAVRPGFVTMPLQTVSGSAALPSVIDIYVNNVRQGSREVGSGPFDITGVPLQSGGGSLQLVVRDLLGREVVSTQNYYASSQLLRKGLHDFSYEIGFLRRDFGVKSNNYGAFLASTTHRYGLSDSLTGEALLQLTEKQQVAGLGINAVVGEFGIVSGSANASRSDRGTGHSLAVAFERASASGFSLGARAELASRSYRYLDMAADELAPALSAQAFVDFPFLGGTLGLNYLHRDNRGRDNEGLAGAFGSFALGRLGSLQLFARHSTVGRSALHFGAFLAAPIGGGRTASASVEFDRGRRNSTLTLQKDALVGNGFGYRTSASQGSVNRLNGYYQYNASFASFAADVSRVDKTYGVRLSAAGAVGLLGNGMFASRRLGGSFAAVRLADLPGVRVYADNQLIGKTDARGRLVIPALRAFETNRIRIDEADFPLDVQLDRTEIAVRPFARSGAIVDFAVRRERGVLLRVAQADGTPLPAGTMVIDTAGAGYLTTLDGEIYVPNLTGRAQLRAEREGQACVIDIDVPDNGDPQPLIEGLTCTPEVVYAGR